MTNFPIKQLIIFVLTFVMSSDLPLYAAEKDSQFSVLDMDTVIVRGSRLPRFSKEGRKADNNTTFLSSEDLRETRAASFQEAMWSTEGITSFDGVGNGVDRTFSLRGFEEAEATVFLLDGTRINEVDGNGVVFPLMDMSDVEAVQIDRGSSSPIYGSGAFAGVVHLQTRKPSEKPIGLFGGFSYGNHKTFRFNQGISGTLQDQVTGLDGKYTYYFNGARNLSDGFRPNGEYRVTSFHAKTAYELPDDEGRIYADVKHVNDAVSNPGSMTFDQYQANTDRTLNPNDGRDYRLSSVQIGAEKQLWERLRASVQANWRNNFAHFYTTSVTFADCDAGFFAAPLFLPCASGLRRPDTDLVTTKTRETDLIWQLDYEEEVTSWLENKTMLGMEFRDASSYSLRQDAPNGNVDESSPRETDRSGTPQSYALFWDENLEVNDKWIGHFGMRHSWHSLKTDDALNDVNNFSRRWTDSSLSTGLTWLPWEFMDLFTNYSQGFRVPSISDVNPFNGANSTNLNPETSDSYEIGTRLRWKELAAFKVSWFNIDLEDEIVFDFTQVSAVAPFGSNINIGKSRRTGIETRLDLNPLREIRLYGSYALTKAYVRETGGAAVGVVDDRDIGQIPRNRLTWGMTVVPFERWGEKGKGFSMGLHGAYTGKQHPQSFESAGQALLNSTGGAGHIIKSYTLWNFIASYIYRNTEVFFKIDNLFDNKYYSRAVNATVGSGIFGAGIIDPGNYTFVNPGAPREYVVGMRWEI